MEPIKLLRRLLNLSPEGLDDIQVVVFFYEEYTKAKLTLDAIKDAKELK